MKEDLDIYGENEIGFLNWKILKVVEVLKELRV